MFDTIQRFLGERGIELMGAISLENCTITKPYLLRKENISEGTVFIFAAPYYVDGCGGPISAYAVSQDYHLFFQELFSELTSLLETKFPHNRFVCFSDHSPINEVETAAKCGLGIIGKNGLFITERFSSFVFLAEVITDAKTDFLPKEVKYCEGCGICQSECPSQMSKSECLSAITQKKGKLSDDEIALIKKHGSVWGCDICQKVCPHTKRAIHSGTIYTPIEFFKKDRLLSPTYRLIEEMTDEEFSCRAYSWRGKEIILRNLKLLENK